MASLERMSATRPSMPGSANTRRRRHPAASGTEMPTEGQPWCGKRLQPFPHTVHPLPAGHGDEQCPAFLQYQPCWAHVREQPHQERQRQKPGEDPAGHGAGGGQERGPLWRVACTPSWRKEWRGSGVGIPKPSPLGAPGGDGVTASSLQVRRLAQLPAGERCLHPGCLPQQHCHPPAAASLAPSCPPASPGTILVGDAFPMGEAPLSW